MLENFFIESKRFIKKNNLPYKRYFIETHDLSHRLSIIQGARGVGKTTTIAQYLSNHELDKVLYISLDNILINGNYKIIEIADEFEKNGGQILCLDEIHKYTNWSQELKNIYDKYDNLKIIVSGSFAMHIHKGSYDLSRRAVVYNMEGMSFREFLNLHYQYTFSKYNLADIIENHEEIAELIINHLNDNKIIPLFKKYLEYGYYPYSITMDNKDDFYKTLQQSLNTTIESDLLSIYPNLSGVSITKIKKLLSSIMSSVPFKPNYSDLQKILDIKDIRTLKEYLVYLDDTGIIRMLMANSMAYKNIDKPEKIYMADTNLMNLADKDIGSMRETFFFNQLSCYYSIISSNKGIFSNKSGDFICEEKYIFEVGGKNKDFNQIKDTDNSFLALDDIEIGYKKKIPLWIFGFLY